MIEVDKSHVKHWENKHPVSVPTTIDIVCPTPDCHCSLVNVPMPKENWELSANNTMAFLQINCARCDNKIRIYMIDPPRNHPVKAEHPARLLIIPPQIIRCPFSEKVQTLSPNAAEIYQQALKAELLGLNQVVGMGYRKSLEFLIKDYLCFKHPDDVEAIKSKMLGKCLHTYIDAPEIKACAERAAWLGNDKTHYVQHWSDYDLSDLKKLLELTASWINTQILTQEYQDGMQPRR